MEKKIEQVENKIGSGDKASEHIYSLVCRMLTLVIGTGGSNITNRKKIFAAWTFSSPLKRDANH